MNELGQIDLKEAEAAMAVANTPLFLLRKLRVDPSVHALPRKFEGNALLTALKDALQKEPQTLREMVAPYAYLVALSMFATMSYVKEVATLKAPFTPWYSHIAEVLLKTYTPISRQSLVVPARVESEVPRPTATKSSQQKLILPATQAYRTAKDEKFHQFVQTSISRGGGVRDGVAISRLRGNRHC